VDDLVSQNTAAVLRPEDVLESIGDGYYAVDADWRYVLFNRAAEEFFKVSRDQILGKPMWEVFPQGRGTRFEQACNAAMHDGAVTRFETISAVREGRFVELRIGPLRGGGVTVALTDITERRIAAKRLQELSDANAARVILADAEGRIVFVNEAAERIHGLRQLGVAPEEYTSTYHLLTDDGQPYPFHRLPLMRAVRDGETVIDATWRIRRPDGSEVRASGSARPIVSPGGIRTGAVLTVRDDTERQLAEERLRESTRRLDAILSNTRMAIFLMDERQHCAYMNDAAVRLTGFNWEETIGRPLHYVIHHTKPDGSHFPLEDCAIDRAFPENNQQEGEEVFVHKDGRFYPVAFTASPIRDEDSKTIGTIVEVRDITREKQDQRARELLMREVDHRARNALAVVQSILRLTAANDITSYRETVLGRVDALARAQGTLAERQWHGAGLADVIEGALSAVAAPEHYNLAGPEIMLTPEQVQPLSMIVHELATNARKYGALSTSTGRLLVSWKVIPAGIEFTWLEEGGPPVVEPEGKGFGSRLIQQLAAGLGASFSKEWLNTGIVAHLVIPPAAPHLHSQQR
jgi:PAS domain S-box-containing protein